MPSEICYNNAFLADEAKSPARFNSKD